MTTAVLFGTLLKETRFLKSLKLIDLAYQLGIDKGVLSKIENNERQATKVQLEAIIKCLNGDIKVFKTAWLASRLIQEIKDEEYGLEAISEARQIVQSALIPNEKLDAMMIELTNLKNQFDILRNNASVSIDDLIQANKIEYTYQSIRLEDNALTLQEMAILIEKGTVSHGKSMHMHLEVINHAEAIEAVLELVKHNTPLHESVLTNLHTILMRGIDNENGGQYRDIQLRVDGSSYLPPSPSYVKRMMDDLFLFFALNEKKMHPIELASTMHSKIMNIHPFIKGNGIIARLVMTIIALQNGYPLILNSDENKSEYLNAIETMYLSPNSNAFNVCIAQYTMASLSQLVAFHTL